MERAEVWHAGEELAVAHLERLGWRILERNWRCPAGELDIVALQPGREPVVVFCEVKCRTGLGFGPPLEAITAHKVAKLREVALHWLRAQPTAVGRIRFDGVGVLLTRDAPPVITHVPGIGR
ncbi:MAG: YraN family protein [Propionicimonas sp.]|uniref:YraN family protein n=1 Tax=Propionicimonas sp. TaxID=1955623 RepID=UPI003D0EFB55